MDARPVALVAGAALAAWLFVSLQRDLARLGARWEARALASAAYAAMAAGWTAVLLQGAPTWLAWVATAGAFAVTVAPRALVRVPRLRTASFRLPALTLPGFTGRDGRPRANRLAAEVGAIRLSMSTLTTSRHERAELRERVERLQRWRAASDPEARELVELVQEAVFERLDGVESDDADGGRGLHDERYAHGEAARQRERRIRELLTRLAH
jgi:hypothetical protein